MLAGLSIRLFAEDLAHEDADIGTDVSGELLHGAIAGRGEALSQQQVFRRITADDELGKAAGRIWTEGRANPIDWEYL